MAASDVRMDGPCRPGPRWAEMDKPMATHRCGRGTSAARSEPKASNWSRTTRTIMRTHIKCSAGRMRPGLEVRIPWGVQRLVQTFLYVHASQGEYERKPAPLGNPSVGVTWIQSLFTPNKATELYMYRLFYCVQNLNVYWLRFSYVCESCKVILSANLAYLDCNPRQGEGRHKLHPLDQYTAVRMWSRWVKITNILMIKRKFCKQIVVFKCTSA